MISDNDIKDYIRCLMGTFGTNHVLQSERWHQMNELYEQSQPTECIGLIREQLHLKLRLRIGYLRGQPSYEGIRKLVEDSIRKLGYPMPKFTAQDHEAMRNMHRIPAFVLRPPNLPLFGTPAFDQFTILLFVARNMLNQPAAQFIYGMAHELAHILLDGIRHPLRNIEQAIDLAVMVLGFADVMRFGRRSMTMRLGYLDDQQFELAYKEVQYRKNIIYL
jgi:hypothetical protein